jgi:hypothetical protein
MEKYRLSLSQAQPRVRCQVSDESAEGQHPLSPAMAENQPVLRGALGFGEQNEQDPPSFVVVPGAADRQGAQNARPSLFELFPSDHLRFAA